MSITYIGVCARDIIVLQNGDIINGFVTEVLTNEIKYKKASNPDGPVYTVEKKEILSIMYENGEIEKFEPTKNNLLSTGKCKIIDLSEEYTFRRVKI